MKRVQVITAEEAALLVNDGATIAMCGCENLLLPEAVLQALGERFRKTGAPAGLTEIHPIVPGMGPNAGLEHLAQRGMVKKAIGSGFSFLKTSEYSKIMRDNVFEAHVVPMGTLFQMLQDIAAGKQTTVTDIGIGTFVDPRIEGGRMNEAAAGSLAEYVEDNGKGMLSYRLFPIDVAIIRGTTADIHGNISMEHEPVSLGVKMLALAAKASGGKVIVQVSRMTAADQIHPRMVEIPGIWVDAVVVDESQRVSGGERMNPYLTGELRIPEPTELLAVPSEVENIILRRAAQEIGENQIVNLGVGIPVGIPGALQRLKGEIGATFMLEHGSVGGFPGGREIFGTNVNPRAIIDSTDVFTFFRGGGLDISFLGFGQIDAAGNVNVSKFNQIVPGCGGFIDITSRTKKLVFCGTFTAGDARMHIENGQLRIEREGKFRKFVQQVEQMTLNGTLAAARGAQVLYVTERAVFALREGGLWLEEIVAGVDMHTHILDLLPFDIRISDDLKQIEAV